ncbi:MAG: hypothetical protein EPO06_06910 [Burkholderiaceae bacterium]|nr:MAG: hypothetical protein EPO06_06910 [Burkholderiaceae bacterium]
MSLIERAMGDQGKQPKKTAATPESSTPEHSSLIERAVAQQPAPAAQAVPPTTAVAETVRANAPTPRRATTPAPTENVTDKTISISIDKMREAGMVTPDGANIEVNAEFRIIKRPLLENAFSRGGQATGTHSNTVMITSAIPGEGKSFCAMNLAMSLAMEPDHNVILVDADVHRFTTLRELGAEAQLKHARGLIDLLHDPALPIEHCIHRTNIDKLMILPFGHFQSRATELFGSRSMLERIDQLCARYQNSMIVFDCPPILATTEARVLAGLMGQVVLIIEAERTTRDQVKEALGYIESANVVGTILNKNLNKAAHDYYASYYYAAA